MGWVCLWGVCVCGVRVFVGCACYVEWSTVLPIACDAQRTGSCCTSLRHVVWACCEHGARTLRLRDVTYLPSCPANGEVLTKNAIRTVGSSTCNGGVMVIVCGVDVWCWHVWSAACISGRCKCGWRPPSLAALYRNHTTRSHGATRVLQTACSHGAQPSVDFETPTWMVGRGLGSLASQMVSPMLACSMPVSAQMSPASTCSTGTRLNWSYTKSSATLPMRGFSSSVVFVR